MGIEESAYTVEKTEGAFQVRQYAPQVVAETLATTLSLSGSSPMASSKSFVIPCPASHQSGVPLLVVRMASKWPAMERGCPMTTFSGLSLPLASPDY